MRGHTPSTRRASNRTKAGWPRRSVAGLAVALGLPALLAGLGVRPAAAQLVLMSPTPAYYDWQYRVSGGASHQFGASIDGGGSFDATRAEGRIGGGGPISQNVRLALDLGYSHTAYDFDQSTIARCLLPAACFQARPWRNVHEVDIAPSGSLVFGEGFQLLAVVPMRWHTEADSTKSGFTAGLIGGAWIRLGERFTTTLGVGIQSELEESMSVFPVVAVDWQISDGFALRTRGGPYQGGEAALLFGAGRPFQLSLSAGYERRRFRLRRSSPDPNGVGQFTAVPLLLGLNLNVRERVFVQLEGGVAVAGRLRLDLANGFSVREEGFDPAGRVGGSLRLVF